MTWIASAIDVLSAALMAVGVGFFVAGTVGLLRFPDLFTRLHALTKADNLGLGLICLGLALQAETLPAILKLLLIWLLTLLASALSCHLIARYVLHAGRTVVNQPTLKKMPKKT